MRADQRGSTIPLVVGLTSVLLIAGAVVVDATAGYLQRQGLGSLADGAALYGADAGAQGVEVYGDGLGQRLRLTEAEATAAVGDYLVRTSARERYPGLRFAVAVTEERVEVRLSAPLDLPLHVPGSPHHPVVGATGVAAVGLDP
ncbi:pilus assembly protein TadG-related protein [Nocardioides sp.]|uniref:pilus assembly protein TadG-related protein n=1 Tax=Nocardioides sp. TaxID=35761 RepID=UPI0039E4E11F